MSRIHKQDAIAIAELMFVVIITANAIQINDVRVHTSKVTKH